jgi:glycosyltransferase involved in cell wall biosynthesis
VSSTIEQGIVTAAVHPQSATRNAQPLDVSVLVPAKDEAENLPLFMEQADATFRSHPDISFEVVVIDDGSEDATWTVVQQLARRYPFLSLARHRSRRGIADALRTGYLRARGRVLVFYPADLQFKPEDIPSLVAPILADEADMVTGYKEGKYEKALVSGVYNRLSRLLFDIKVKDLNSVKAYRREVMDNLPVRPDWHRYMVVIAAAQGFKVTEVPIPLYPRHAGRSKFATWHRIPIGVMDMLSVWFELRFGQKPLLLFAVLGFAVFGFGVLAGLVAVARLWMYGVGQRWVWSIIQTCILLGSVFFATGMLGDQIAAQRAQLRELQRRVDEQRVHDERDGR